MKNPVKDADVALCSRCLNVITKTSKIFHAIEGYKYMIKFGADCKTSLYYCKTWLARFDVPHKGVPYPHLNLRHKFTGFKDPHARLPPGTLETARVFGYCAKTLKLLGEIAVVYDVARLGTASYKDLKNGTTENTVRCATDIAFCWLGGFGGSFLGCAVGCVVPFGIGNFFGAMAGGAAGVYYGTAFAKDLLNTAYEGKPLFYKSKL